MLRRRMFSALANAVPLLVLSLCTVGSNAFIFGRDRPASPPSQPSIRDLSYDGSTGVFSAESRLPNIYAVALTELQELESEPLCHRTAARLLVNNCQLLAGKDETTVLTDSGRRIRDFVDSYAASLAICDLERGAFVIPQSCSKFREDTLSRLPLSPKPVLHVSTREIDKCLSGLADSSSAWNTWVSYRHKALRFCEAARVDQDKAQSIHLYQRITKILENLTTGVELELEKRLSSVDQRAREASDSLDRLRPRINDIGDDLANMAKLVSGDLVRELTGSIRYSATASEDAKKLQTVIGILAQTVMKHNTDMVAFNTAAIQQANEQVGSEMNLVMSSLAATMAVSASLQEWMDSFRLQAVQLEEKQQSLETGMGHLLSLTTEIDSQHQSHQKQLEEARNKASAILEVLVEVGDSAGILQSAIGWGWGVSRLWPYLVCPVASLMMGSYGLPPSVFRNLGLIVMGEFAGLMISVASTYTAVFPSQEAAASGSAPLNTTPAPPFNMSEINMWSLISNRP